MTDKEFRAFLDLIMFSDPWPTGVLNQQIMLLLAAKEALKREFDGKVDAFRKFLEGEVPENIPVDLLLRGRNRVLSRYVGWGGVNDHRESKG